MSKPIKDFFHSEKLHKGGNMKVFNEVYQKISDIVDERVKMEIEAFNLNKDDDVIPEISTIRSKYYYDRILYIVNLVINKWEN
jgi:hypothetical protein|tara:strand:+ start:115 stop:363 length:249 start_codon:yes stop_codon:yes gene_type:complete